MIELGQKIYIEQSSFIVSGKDGNYYLQGSTDMIFKNKFAKAIIHSIVGYPPNTAYLFPSVKTLADLEKVITYFIKSSFVDKLAILAKRDNLASEFLKYIYSRKYNNDAILDELLTKDELYKYDQPIVKQYILTKEAYTSWVQYMPTTNLKHLAFFIIKDGYCLVSENDKELFLKEIININQTVLPMFIVEWYEQVFGKNNRQVDFACIHTIEQCCVCYNETPIKILCGHFLCIECKHSLQKRICPLCRSYL